MKRLTFFILFTIALFTRVSGATSYYFKSYGVEDGLSTNTILCSLQDKKGFMWFGTVDGLNKFDGYTFKVLKPERDNSGSIDNSTILSLAEGADGIIWVGTRKGLYKLNTHDGCFSPVASTLELGITNLSAAVNGDLWFMSHSKVFSYTPASGKLHMYKAQKNIDATSLCTSADGSVWVGTGTGLVHKINPRERSMATFDLFEHSQPAKSRNIYELHDANPQYLLVGTGNQGVKLFNKITKKYEDILTHNKNKSEIYVRDFMHYAGDEYWVATEVGIFIYNIKTRKYLNLVKSRTNPYSISDNAVYTLCKDKEGGVWLGSFFGGLNYFHQQNNLFKKYFPGGDENSISGNAVREICEDKLGNLWIATEDAGLNKLDQKTGKLTSFTPTGKKTDISYTNIHGIMALDNHLWIGTFEHGLDIMDINTNKVVRHYDYGADSNSLKSNFVNTFYRTTLGKIYVATSHGLYTYNPGKDNFSTVSFPGTDYPFVYSILEDSKRNIWIGTIENGVYRFDSETGAIKQFVYDPRKNNSLNSNRVNGIFQASDGTIWMATEGGGLCKFIAHNETFKRYTVNNGLPSNFVFRILEDSNKKLWISTSRGLVHFDPANEKIVTYTQSNGLLNDQFNYNSAYKDPDTGEMYFGSVKGMIRFNPKEFKKGTYIPPVFITDFDIYNAGAPENENKSFTKKPLFLTDTIVLAHNQSSFNIGFSALSYTSPETTEYSYILEGLDKSWTYLQTNRRAYFTKVAPGTYTFLVKAGGKINNFNERPTKLVIKILPPIWKTPLAYLLYLILGASAVYIMFKSYGNKIKSRHRQRLAELSYKKEKEVYEAKIDFFTNITHEIRTPLTLIKGPMEKMIKRADEAPFLKKNLLVMERNTARLLELTEQLLDFRKVENDSFSLSFTDTDIVALLKEIYQSFKPAAAQKKISFHLDIPYKSFIVSTDTEAFNKIIYNLLSNAIKYSLNHITISMTDIDVKQNRFSIKVKSNGHLITEDIKEKIFDTFFRVKETRMQPGTGLGLGLSRSLAELLGGCLKLDTPENNMNIFVLILPIRIERKDYSSIHHQS